MGRSVLTAVAVLGVGCATGFADARLASLPRVPAQLEVPTFPPALRGLTFRVQPRFDGDTSRVATGPIADHCVDNFERWLGAAGWTPVRDPSTPTDLVIDEYCAVRLSMSAASDHVLEIQRPANETVAIVVTHDGAPLVTVPRGPSDYACESDAGAAMRRDCSTRAERWAQANILDTLIASPALAALARRLGAR